MPLSPEAIREIWAEQDRPRVEAAIEAARFLCDPIDDQMVKAQCLNPFYFQPPTLHYAMMDLSNHVEGLMHLYGPLGWHVGWDRDMRKLKFTFKERSSCP